MSVKISSYKSDIIARAVREIIGEQPVSISSEFHKDTALIFKVNWSAIGSQLPSAAREFANTVYKACELAGYLTELELQVDWLKEEYSVNGISNDTYVCIQLLSDISKYSLMLTEWLEGEYNIDYNKGNLKRCYN